MLVDMAVTGPLMRTSHRRVNNQILSYQTATHSRHETGRPGYAVEGSYRSLFRFTVAVDCRHDRLERIIFQPKMFLCDINRHAKRKQTFSLLYRASFLKSRMTNY